MPSSHLASGERRPSRTLRALLPLLALPGLSVPTAASGGDPPNVIVVLADDFGVDLVGAYAEAPAPPCTPTLDGLAAQGLLFRNAWAYPVCSATRAALLTGRHGFRTGIGNVLMNAPGLPLAELTLAEALRDSGAAYATTAVGKWHLSGNLGPNHPNQSGFDHFAGTLQGGVPDYQAWNKTVDGATSPTTAYATVDTTDEALAAVATLAEPWFLYVNYHAPHTPWHAPPAQLCPDSGGCPASYCGNLGPNPTPPEYVKAMTEVMDAELGRLLAAVDTGDTYVLFLGDNGTARQASEAPFTSAHAKGSVFEGGVNVPLLVRGPGVSVGEAQALVSVTDLFATIGELTGTGLTADDSVSFAPVLTDPAASPRATVYAERFTGAGGTPPLAGHDLALRDARYKLVRREAFPDQLYDLTLDPFETQDLLPTATADQLAAYDRLRADVQSLHTGAGLVGLPASVSLGSGGAQQLVLAAGAPLAGNVYVVLGSASGVSPGIPLDGMTLYLNYDGYMAFSLAHANGSFFQDTLGLLGATGTAHAAVSLPAGLSPSMAGATLRHAALALGGSGAVTWVSLPEDLVLAP